MYYILYNSTSNGGKTFKKALKVQKKISKTENTKIEDLLRLTGKERALIASLSEMDKVLLIGGDGTIHYFLNHIEPCEMKCRLYVLAAGRGNDLARDYKKHHIFEITHLAQSLPSIKVNGLQKQYFINGVGMGVDSMVCSEQIKNSQLEKKESYFHIALRVFKTFKPYQLDIQIDGKTYHYDKVWFFVCNHGRYFGGGMKITPKAIREDDVLDICVVHNIKLHSLLLVFPLVFIGWHRFFRKKSLIFMQGKHIHVIPKGCEMLQEDGDVSSDIHELEIQR